MQNYPLRRATETEVEMNGDGWVGEQDRRQGKQSGSCITMSDAMKRRCRSIRKCLRERVTGEMRNQGKYPGFLHGEPGGWWCYSLESTQ